MKIIKGYINCGIKNPFYNDMVELEVLQENVGYYGKGIYVRTVEKRKFNHCLIDIETNKVTKEWEEIKHYENYLDQTKPFEVIS